MDIYIGNLPGEITEEDLQKVFKPFGEVEIISIIKDKLTGKSKGFGFVEMSHRVEGEAAIKAIWGGETKYTAVDGTPALKDAVIAKFKRENGLTYERNQISVNSGGKHTIYNAFVATLNPGDEVIIPTPYWVSYPDMALLAGGEPVFVEASAASGFKITPADLEAAKTIHSDFKEKFIRAEAVNWEKLVLAGSWSKAREKGQISIIGKDYLIKDGDVIEFKI